MVVSVTAVIVCVSLRCFPIGTWSHACENLSCRLNESWTHSETQCSVCVHCVCEMCVSVRLTFGQDTSLVHPYVWVKKKLYWHRERTIKQESNHLYGVKVEFYINPNKIRAMANVTWLLTRKLPQNVLRSGLCNNSCRIIASVNSPSECVYRIYFFLSHI